MNIEAHEYEGGPEWEVMWKGVDEDGTPFGGIMLVPTADEADAVEEVVIGLFGDGFREIVITSMRRVFE